MKAKKLSTSTVWLMIGTAAILDALEIAFGWLGIGFILSVVQYGVFGLWFMLHGLNFFSLRKKAAWGFIGGTLIEIFTAGILPGFTVVVVSAIANAQAQASKEEGKIVGEINPNSGDKRDLDRTA